MNPREIEIGGFSGNEFETALHVVRKQSIEPNIEVVVQKIIPRDNSVERVTIGRYRPYEDIWKNYEGVPDHVIIRLADAMTGPDKKIIIRDLTPHVTVNRLK